MGLRERWRRWRARRAARRRDGQDGGRPGTGAGTAPGPGGDGGPPGAGATATGERTQPGEEPSAPRPEGPEAAAPDVAGPGGPAPRRAAPDAGVLPAAPLPAATADAATADEVTADQVTTDEVTADEVTADEVASGRAAALVASAAAGTPVLLAPEAQAVLAGLALPQVVLAPAPAHATPPTSRLGGRPLLHADTAWPARDGQPLHHLLTVDLAELGDAAAALPGQGRRAAGELPDEGLLAFFHLPGEDVWGYDPDDRDAWAVLQSARDGAQERETPGGGHEYRERRVALRPRWSFPPADALALAPVHRAGGSPDAVRAVLAALPASPPPRHVLLGWAPEGDAQARTAVAAASSGAYAGAGPPRTGFPPGPGSGEGGAGAPPRAAGEASGAPGDPDDWLLLAEVDSDDELGMLWGDECRLCFWAPRRAGEAARPAEVWMVVRCG